MGRLATALGCLAAGTAAISPIGSAAACTPVAITAVTESMLERGPKSEAALAFERDLRRACEQVHPSNERFLRDVRKGRYEDNFVQVLALSFESGRFGCERDPGFALRIFDALVPDPVPLDLNPYRLDYVVERAGIRSPVIANEREREILGSRWLLSATDFSLVEKGWSKARIERFVMRPGIWEFALAHFGPDARMEYRHGENTHVQIGFNTERDETVFRLLTDPASPKFDRTVAAGLAWQSGQWRHIGAAMTLLLDPRFGAPDIARAAEIAPRGGIPAARMLLDPRLGDAGLAAAEEIALPWYSPYVHLDRSRGDELAAALWQDIARRLIASDDPQRRERGEGILRTGDPRFSRTVVPDVAGTLVALEDWPDALPLLSYGTPERWADWYPARAVRDEIGGRTELAVLFGPDGAFQQVWVTRPSGSEVLDKAATDGALRYFRPKLGELRLAGHEGTYTLVPLVNFEWHMGATPERPVGVRIEGRTIEIVERPRLSETC